MSPPLTLVKRQPLPGIKRGALLGRVRKVLLDDEMKGEARVRQVVVPLHVISPTWVNLGAEPSSELRFGRGLGRIRINDSRSAPSFLVDRAPNGVDIARLGQPAASLGQRAEFPMREVEEHSRSRSSHVVR